MKKTMMLNSKPRTDILSHNPAIDLKPVKWKKILLIGTIIVVLAIIAAYIFHIKGKLAPTMSVIQIQSPEKISATDYNEFVLDVTLSDMTKNVLFPAASMSATFDNAKLEFLGIMDGNVLILANGNAVGNSLGLPNWSVNPEYANKTGKLNIMYLDSTAGKCAFCSNGFDSEKQNVLFRLRFKLRGSALVGDIYNLVITDAVLAASDSNKSMMMTANTLQAIDGKIIVGK